MQLLRGGGGSILTTKLLLRKVSNHYILKAKVPTAKPFADIRIVLYFRITTICDQPRDYNRKKP